MQKQEKNNETFIKETSIRGLLIIERPVYPDDRGLFHEIARLNDLAAISNIDFKPVQFSYSISKPRVIRAIHVEKVNKLVYPITGKLFSAYVDTRVESPTFGKYETYIFDCEDPKSPHSSVFVPSGVGNSICVMGNNSVNYFYALDEYWKKENEIGIAWDDPDLNIPWPVKEPIISERDRGNPRLRDLFPEKFSHVV